MSLVEYARPIQLIAGILALCCIVTGQQDAPLHGTWALNMAKSTFASAPAYKKSTCRIEPWQDGLKVTYDIIGTRGGITHLEWIGKLDGKDYPIEGVDEVLTNAYTRVDERTFDIVVKSDGAKAATARIVVSPDGKTLTTVTTTRNAQSTTVYDKR